MSRCTHPAPVHQIGARPGSNYSPGKVIISASAGGYDNSRYFFEDNAENLYDYGHLARDGVAAVGVAQSNILYRTGEPHIDRGTNVAGYLTHGIYTWLSPDYPLNSNVVFTGSSSWYIMMTVESLNGFRYSEDRQQGTFIKWFSENAFGGTNFSNTPIGSASHTDEPGGENVNDSKVFFSYWATGKLFSLAAWASRRTPHFQAVGDPFVKK